ncbi:lysyl-tRNA synthetase [Candidatus Photodesmus katoptron]|uniref:Lysine--tRNA ligase n=1 Tax=Candidatus Photodesmus katoptron Akat1 TaxID=1236703 RepID=S3DFY6_9GAMM|nr:lysine--tRNA ligase [Candidatus Photodesmus katoptron]EPE37292.1 lysyl-tRNA synthetase, LysRS [Candidatus Photodesmus katoptron Akat1]KEY90037.1 lysyl-tRNA synthetase [Candidatus Photodesmus katoptron]
MIDSIQHKQHTKEESTLTKERRKKLQHIRKNCDSNGYPNSFRRDNFANDLQVQFSNHTKEELKELKYSVSVAGRIIAKRGPFLVIQEISGCIQIYLNKSLQTELKNRYKQLDIGDIIGIKGILDKSKKGDLYIKTKTYELLTKALHPLPEKFHGLSDQEIRYRHRYIDLIVNKKSREVFIIRSKLIAAIRSFMISNNYIEVETPMMHTIPGGATARPFVTHHNALNSDLYLRIAPELYLKQLVIGGFERVFEINRNFRNEGLSPHHNPEFTTIEFYQAYSDYNELMNFTENMLSSISLEVLGSTSISYGNIKIEFSGPYVRMSMFESIRRYNINHAQIQSLKEKDLQNHNLMLRIAKSIDITIERFFTCGQLIEKIFTETVEPYLIQPTFITDYPADISPLARHNDKNPFFSDRFEFFVAGHEIANGFSELNDSEDQNARFKSQVYAKNAGDDEAMYYDADYITALEYGLPPTAGQGIGIDRLVMLFSDTHNIKDVILFPAMRK